MVVISFMLLWFFSQKGDNRLPKNSDNPPLHSQDDGNKSADSVSGIKVIKNKDEGGGAEGGAGYQGQEIPSEKNNLGPFVKIHQLKAVEGPAMMTEPSGLPGERPYTLEVFSGSTPAVIQTELKRLQDKGMESLFVSEVGSDHLAPRWNIYLGNFPSEDDALKSTWHASVPEAHVRCLPYALLLALPEKAGNVEGVRKTLEADGYYPWSERMEDGQYHLFLGAYSSRKEAMSWVRELQQEGIATVVVRK
jgi:hypothetical protein